MQKRKIDELISHFNRKVADMDIDRKYKMELLGMITAIGIACEKELSIEPERKTGKWIDAEWENINTGEKRKGRRCSACGSGFFRYDVSVNTVSDIPNYCPNCGADMRGGNER